MSSSIKISLDISNIGKHELLNFSSDVSTNKTAIYGQNGAGKTSISRLFRLSEKSELNIDSLLSLGEEKGSFCFTVQSATDPSVRAKKLEIRLQKGKPPEVSNPSGYFFHVFNSDYVEENIKAHSCLPSDDIEGYIIGKENIDVKEEEAQLKAIQEKGEELLKEINNAIDQGKTELKRLKISPNTTNFKKINKDSVMKMPLKPSKNSFQELINQYKKFSSLSDDIDDLKTDSFSFKFESAEKIINILETPYTKAMYAQGFLEYVRDNLGFVKAGVSLNSSNKDQCPFCKQPLGASAKELIDNYNFYLENEEAQTIEQIHRLKNQCDSLSNSYSKQYSQILKESLSFANATKYIPSLQEVSLGNMPQVGLIEELVNRLRQLLDNKEGDISKEILEGSEIADKLETVLSEAELTYKSIVKQFKMFNSIKNNSINELRKVRNNLCEQKANDIRHEQDKNIKKYIEKKNEWSNTYKKLKEKQERQRRLKKEIVIENYKSLLSYFFDSKYSFDDKNFCLVFKENLLKKTAPEKILSDGEKNIIAFCYYIATTSLCLENKTDFNNLFFIIDDPISSLDFHYVYMLSQLIRKLTSYVGIEGDSSRNLRYIILTHNAEFFSMLLRNNVVSNKYTLEETTLKRVKTNTFTLHREHLKDIYKVANLGVHSAHTTPNSIRYILEWLWRIESPQINSFEDYFLSIEELKDDQYLYSLINDISHGNEHFEPPYSENCIQNACKKIIDLIGSKLPGQLQIIQEEVSQ